jgi:predicted AlkP superfamily phosphohydrolase/phosphomutase
MKVVSRAYSKNQVFKGAYLKDAPDIFVGFNRGYRASWQTALGGAASELIEDNEKKWSGDHLIDSELVPGVVFSNKKITRLDPSIVDIAATVYKVFDIDEDPSLPDSRPLF